MDRAISKIADMVTRGDETPARSGQLARVPLVDPAPVLDFYQRQQLHVELIPANFVSNRLVKPADFMVSIALERLRGGDPRVGDGLRVATPLPQIRTADDPYLHNGQNDEAYVSDLAGTGGVAAGLDIDLGIHGARVGPVRKAFAERGVALSGTTLWRLRAGATSSARTALRLAGADRLRRNDASLRTRFCLRLAEMGVMNRRYDRERGDLFGSAGFMRLIAEAVGCDANRLRACVRGMRADLCLTDAKDEELNGVICDIAWTFLYVHRRHRRPSHVPEAVRAIEGAWDNRTIGHFYRLLHLVGGTRTIAAWFPYEVSAMERFYARQVAAGSPLTPLDRLVLESAEHPGESTRSLRTRVLEITGVDFDYLASSVYRYLLVYSTPSLPP